MGEIRINIDNESPVPKFQQLAGEIRNAINNKKLMQGDPLPSVNAIIRASNLSRDTVVKGYNLLKRGGIIESYPQKGYFVSGNTGRVFLFLDTFKAYKEVLYHSFYDNLPQDYAIDLHFHHYDIDVFEKMIDESQGKYSSYIIMNFDHPRVKEIVKKIDPQKLLIIDWNIHAPLEAAYIIQDFGRALYMSLESGIEYLTKYKRFIFVYPNFTYHPEESIVFFKQFCEDSNIEYVVQHDSKKIVPQKGDLFLLVSDRVMAGIFDKSKELNLEIGSDIGIISYNETPMKKYIMQGITVVSTDFEEMGRRAAEFVAGNSNMRTIVPTKLIVRNSI